MKKNFILILSALMILFPKQVFSGHQGILIPDCDTCHISNLVRQHGEFSAPVCATCHDSQEEQIRTTIAQGKQGQVVHCTDCHGSVDHSLAHDQTFLPPGECADCHVSDVAGEHAEYDPPCNICHKNINPQVQVQFPWGRLEMPFTVLPVMDLLITA